MDVSNCKEAGFPHLKMILINEQDTSINICWLTFVYYCLLKEDFSHHQSFKFPTTIETYSKAGQIASPFELNSNQLKGLKEFQGLGIEPFFYYFPWDSKSRVTFNYLI